MDLAVVCLLVLVGVLAVSCVTSQNVGLAALAAAWIIGMYVAPHYGTTLGIKDVTGGFPVDLFLTLAGTTLLFAAAQVNGTLGLVVERGVRLCGDNARLVPPLYFLLALGLAAIGPGNIASPALLAPSALALAARLRIPPLVMIIAVAHGAIAGGASPVTPIGVIVADKYRTAGLEGAFASTCLWNAAANLLFGFFGCLIFGGRWWTAKSAEGSLPTTAGADPPAAPPFARAHLITLLTIGALLAAVLSVPKLHLGLAAFTAATLLFLTRSAQEGAAIRAMPWNVILLVCGVSTFVALCEKTGAVDLLSRSMKHVADGQTLVGWSAFFTGLISIFSSTSGVVLPTFLPAVGDMVREVGGGNPATVATGIVIGSSAVDVSPLSTIGALCIAAAGENFVTRPLFNRMLVWGFAMAPLAALLCQWML